MSFFRIRKVKSGELSVLSYLYCENIKISNANLTPLSLFNTFGVWCHFACCRKLDEPVRFVIARSVCKEAESFSIGTKVLHPKFGPGIVINRSGEEEDLKLEVFFRGSHGKKKLAANLANLIIL